jgi:CPA2 family monovalent cation:H+ antiporter-2
MDSTAHDLSRILTELGLVVIGLAILARIASRWYFSAIPLYLLAGLAFGKGGLAPLNLSENFIHIGADIGVLLLLFMLGLEYTAEDLIKNLRFGFLPGIVDLLLNFLPGFVAGFVFLHWTPLAASLLGGVTYISSSGIAARLLSELKRLQNVETPLILSLLVLEDLTMAIYLPVLGVLLLGGGPAKIAVSVLTTTIVILCVLAVAVRYGNWLSRLAAHESDEIILLTTFGTVLLVSALAQHFQVSAAIGAFLVGIAVSGPIAEQSHRLLSPLRDLFAAIFFFFFGLEIDPGFLPKTLPFALALGVVTALSKVMTGYWTAGRAGLARPACVRAGATLVARGEFSIVIAGLGSGIEPRLMPLAATYVFFTAILGLLLSRVTK